MAGPLPLGLRSVVAAAVVAKSRGGVIIADLFGYLSYLTPYGRVCRLLFHYNVVNLHEKRVRLHVGEDAVQILVEVLQPNG